MFRPGGTKNGPWNQAHWQGWRIQYRRQQRLWFPVNDYQLKRIKRRWFHAQGNGIEFRSGCLDRVIFDVFIIPNCHWIPRQPHTTKLAVTARRKWRVSNNGETFTRSRAIDSRSSRSAQVHACEMQGVTPLAGKQKIPLRQVDRSARVRIEGEIWGNGRRRWRSEWTCRLQQERAGTKNSILVPEVHNSRLTQ